MHDRKAKIEETLSHHLAPAQLLVDDESYKHHVPDNAQTHFKVTIVSSAFDSQPLIKRHRMINELLQDEFSSGLHALSIHAYTSDEWAKRQNQSPQTPSCRDGYKFKKD